MDRDLYGDLLKWKNMPDHKPLIIRGVRQCGKTYLMRKFGKENYPNTAYLKFEGNESLCKIFDGDLDPERLVTALSIHLDMEITSDTLLIFDEIQECERALISLKSFRESAPEYDILCAGSLLGLQGKGSFPVGKVSFLNLYPMNFREFVRASNEKLYRYIESNKIPDNISREPLKELYLEYLAVGGMPEAVSKWVDTKNMSDVDSVLGEIADSYRLDFLKHVPAKDVKKVNLIWSSIPSQLASENKRFFFGRAVKGARSGDLEDALQWLIDAGLVYKVPRIEKIGIPIHSFASDNLFKVYMADIGILRRLAEVPASYILEKRLDPLFLGGFIENYVMCELTAYGHHGQGYWVSGNSAEVDFLIMTESGIIPIEVKSGGKYHAASLKEYMDRFMPEKAIVVSGKNYLINGDVATVPLYSIWVIDNVLSS